MQATGNILYVFAHTHTRTHTFFVLKRTHAQRKLTFWHTVSQPLCNQGLGSLGTALSTHHSLSAVTHTHTNMETSSPCSNFHNLQKQAFLSAAAALACKQGIFLHWNTECVCKHACSYVRVCAVAFVLRTLYVLSATCKCVLCVYVHLVFSGSAHTCGPEHLGVRLHDGRQYASVSTHRRLNPHLMHTFPNTASKLNFRAKYIPQFTMFYCSTPVQVSVSHSAWQHDMKNPLIP